MILQCCVAYGPPIDLEEAAKQEQKTKVKYDNDVIHRFQYLVKEDNDYYGIDKKNGEIIKTKIDIDQIRNVRVYDRTRSTTATILTPIILTGVVIGIAAATWSGPTLNWGN